MSWSTFNIFPEGAAMVEVTLQDGTCTHTGSACSPPVAGTLTVGSNAFVSVGSTLIMVEDGTMEVPSHLPPSCIPPLETHSYSPDTFGQTFVTIEGLKMCLVGDSYSPDPTEIDSAGSNGFVEVV